MNTETIIKSLNMKSGEILTLEKAKDRLEFEALPIMIKGCVPNFFPEDCCKGGGTLNECDCDRGATYDPCSWKNDQCGVKVPACPFDSITPCECKGPVGYIDQDHCHPYTTCTKK